MNICRFSYLGHVQQILPKSFKEVIPVTVEPVFKFAVKPGELTNSQQPLIITAQKLMTSIKSKCTNDEAHSILKEGLADMAAAAAQDDSIVSTATGYDNAQIDVFFTVLFFLGSKSFSHAYSALSKFHTVCRVLTSTREGQMQAITSLHEVWLHHDQMVVVIMDKMLKLQLISGDSVVRWLFTEPMRERLPMLYVWEIVHDTITKVSRHAIRLTREAEQMRDQWEAYQSKVRDGFDLEPAGGGDALDIPTRDRLERMDERVTEARAELRALLRSLLCGCIKVLSQLELPRQSAYWHQLQGRVEEILFKVRGGEAVDCLLVAPGLHVTSLCMPDAARLLTLTGSAHSSLRRSFCI